MILEKRENCVLTISDFSVIRSKDVEDIILQILKNKFEGICFKKAFIHEVIKILKLSDFEFNQNDINNCSFNIEVLFVCKCEYFISEEPVMDMQILNMKSNSITLGSKNKIAVVKEFKQEEIKEFKVGDILPVKSLRCIFEPGSNKIKMGCVMLSNDNYKTFSEIDKNIIYSVKPSQFNFSFLHGISKYCDDSYKEDIDNSLVKSKSKYSITYKSNISFSKLLELLESDSKDIIRFSYDNVYGDNITIHKENNSKDDVDVDSAFLFGIAANQYVLRNTINVISGLEKDKSILQNYFKKYYSSS